MSNDRFERMSSLISQLLGEILRDITETLGIAHVSIVQVQVSPDMSWADVDLSFLESDRVETDFALLQKNLYDIQGELNRKLTVKKIPRIRLHKDRQIEEIDHIDTLLDSIK